MSLALRRFWIQITADRRRFSVLCFAVGMGLLLWARLIVVNNMPRTAMATENAPASEKPAAKGAKKSQPAKAAPANKTPVRIALDESPARDPFVISRKHFPSPTLTAPTDDDQAKSSQKPVDEAERTAAQLEARLHAGMSRLRLEAAMGGLMAVINGRSYRVGDSLQVEGDIVFRLEQVGQRSVTISWGDRRFELEMSSPGD